MRIAPFYGVLLICGNSDRSCSARCQRHAVLPEGIESSRPCGHQILILECLPFHQEGEEKVNPILHRIRSDDATSRSPFFRILDGSPASLGADQLTF
jgi:hypothetical protein